MTAKQIKDLIRNQAKTRNIAAQILLRNYMLERLLERISLSKYKRHFILKGGMLIASLIGIETRATIDMDATIKGYPVSEEDLGNAFEEIIHTQVEDDINIELRSISEIHEEADYPCFRLSLMAKVDNTRIPIKVDITSGDIITPCEIQYRFSLLLEERSIDILAYNLETVLAEKMESIMSRGVLNTRMRDFYDIHILQTLQSENIDYALLNKAIKATAGKRGTEQLFENTIPELVYILQNTEIIRLWGIFCKKFSYASNLEYEQVSKTIKDLFEALHLQ